MLENDRGRGRGRHGDPGGQAAGHGRAAGRDPRVASSPDTLVVSLAAGVDTASIEARLPDGVAGGPGDAQHPGPGRRGDGGHLRRLAQRAGAPRPGDRDPVRHRPGGDGARALPGRGDRDLRLGSGVPVLRGRGDDRGRRPSRACPGTSPPSWWCRPCSARPSCCARPASIPPCCASGSPRRAAPPRRRSAQLEDHKVRAAFIGAMEAARDRSRELAAAARRPPPDRTARRDERAAGLLRAS